MEKDKEIKKLKSNLDRYPFELKSGEKILSVIFSSVDQKIHYSLICKNTDKFNIIENKLYKEYPNYSELNNIFIVNGKNITKNKTLEENNINDSDIIMVASLNY